VNVLFEGGWENGIAIRFGIELEVELEEEEDEEEDGEVLIAIGLQDSYSLVVEGLSDAVCGWRQALG